MGVQGADQSEKVDNGRVEKFLKTSARSFTAARIKGTQLKFDHLDLSVANAAALSPPTIDPKAFVQTCPNAVGALPLRQDILDLMGQKIKSEGIKQEFDEIVKKHNAAHNRSGVPYKGEAKRTAQEVDREGMAEEMARAKVYGPEVKGPKVIGDVDQDNIFPGQHPDHQFCIKDGKLYAYAVDDCLISSKLPVLRFWGEFLCGTEKKKEILKFKANHYMWEMTSMDFVASFSIQTKGQEPKGYKSFSPAPLSDFMAHLEDLGKVNTRVECHTLKEVTSEVQGQKVTAFELEPSEECLFMAKALPPKTKAVKVNAGSLMSFSGWDFVNLKHEKGRVRIVPGLAYDDEHNTIVPVKPVIFLTEPISVKKGQFVLLG